MPEFERATVVMVHLRPGYFVSLDATDRVRDLQLGVDLVHVLGRIDGEGNRLLHQV